MAQTEPGRRVLIACTSDLCIFTGTNFCWQLAPVRNPGSRCVSAPGQWEVNLTN
jgi:hypothetical protein